MTLEKGKGAVFSINDNEFEKYKNINPRVRQVFVALGPIILTIGLGMIEGYSATTLPQLENDELGVDKEMSSWIASLAVLPMGPGCLLGGYLMEVIGRRLIHQLSGVLYAVGWVLIAFSQNVEMILVGRFIGGICLGILGPPSGVYISEIADPSFRGFLLPTLSFALALGIFLIHLIGTYISWRTAALYSIAVPLIGVLATSLVPESPTFLAKLGKYKQAQHAFFWCRGLSPSSIEECNILLERQKQTSKPSLKNNISYLLLPQFYKPLIIITVYFITMQLSGNNAITFYAVDIINSVNDGNVDEYFVMILIDIFRLIISFLACVVMNKLNRRPHTIISGLGSVISLACLSGYILLQIEYPSLEQYSFIALASLVSFIVFLAIGLAPIPWAMMGEVFPVVTRGVGSGISSFVNLLVMFLVIKTTPTLFEGFGPGGAFLLYGILTFIGVIFLWKFLPETRNKALHEIEDYFK